MLDRAGGKPVAVVEGERVLGYFVPVEAVQDVEARYATREEVMESKERG